MSLSHRPDGAVRRADELCLIGQHDTALEHLLGVLSTRRNRQWSPQMEGVTLRFVELCLKYNRMSIIRDGLLQYRQVSVPVNQSSFEQIIKAVRSHCDKALAGLPSDVQSLSRDLTDLDDIESGEGLVGLALFGMDASSSSGDHATEVELQKKAVRSALQRVWELLRTILEVCRNQPSLEEVHHETAVAAMDFCQKYNRRMEFRRLCDSLRLHFVPGTSNFLTQAGASQTASATASGAQTSTGAAPGYQGYVPAVIVPYGLAGSTASASATLASQQDPYGSKSIDTRLHQMKVAISLELWMVAFVCAEECFALFGKRKASAAQSIQYYALLASILHASNNPQQRQLFHAGALIRCWHVLSNSMASISSPTAQQAVRDSLSWLLGPGNANKPSAGSSEQPEWQNLEHLLADACLVSAAASMLPEFYSTASSIESAQGQVSGTGAGQQMGSSQQGQSGQVQGAQGSMQGAAASGSAFPVSHFPDSLGVDRVAKIAQMCGSSAVPSPQSLAADIAARDVASGTSEGARTVFSAMTALAKSVESKRAGSYKQGGSCSFSCKPSSNTAGRNEDAAEVIVKEIKKLPTALQSLYGDAVTRVAFLLTFKKKVLGVYNRLSIKRLEQLTNHVLPGDAACYLIAQVGQNKAVDFGAILIDQQKESVSICWSQGKTLPESAVCMSRAEAFSIITQYAKRRAEAAIELEKAQALQAEAEAAASGRPTGPVIRVNQTSDVRATAASIVASGPVPSGSAWVSRTVASKRAVDLFKGPEDAAKSNAGISIAGARAESSDMRRAASQGVRSVQDEAALLQKKQQAADFDAAMTKERQTSIEARRREFRRHELATRAHRLAAVQLLRNVASVIGKRDESALRLLSESIAAKARALAEERESKLAVISKYSAAISRWASMNGFSFSSRGGASDSGSPCSDTASRRDDASSDGSSPVAGGAASGSESGPERVNSEGLRGVDLIEEEKRRKSRAAFLEMARSLPSASQPMH